MAEDLKNSAQDAEESFLDAAGEGQPTGKFHNLTPEEIAARNKRNLAVALGIVAFIFLVFGTTVLRLAQNTGGAVS